LICLLYWYILHLHCSLLILICLLYWHILYIHSWRLSLLTLDLICLLNFWILHIHCRLRWILIEILNYMLLSLVYFSLNRHLNGLSFAQHLSLGASRLSNSRLLNLYILLTLDLIWLRWILIEILNHMLLSLVYFSLNRHLNDLSFVQHLSPGTSHLNNSRLLNLLSLVYFSLNRHFNDLSMGWTQGVQRHLSPGTSHLSNSRLLNLLSLAYFSLNRHFNDLSMGWTQGVQRHLSPGTSHLSLN